MQTEMPVTGWEIVIIHRNLTSLDVGSGDTSIIMMMLFLLVFNTDLYLPQRVGGGLDWDKPAGGRQHRHPSSPS